MSHAELGVALFGLAMGALVAMPFSAWAGGKIGSRRVAIGWGALYVALLPCLAYAPQPGVLRVVLFAFGAAHGGLDVAMNAQAVLVDRFWHRPIMSSFHALFSAGGLAAAGVGVLLAALEVPVPWHFTLAAVLPGTVTLWLTIGRMLPDPDDQRVSRGSDVGPVRSFLEPKGRLRLLALGGLAFCIMLGEGAVADWSGMFLKQVAGAGDGVAAAGYAAFSLAMMMGRFFGDNLTLRLGPERLVRWSGLLATGGLLLTLLTPHPYVGVAGFAAVGAGFATIIPQVFSAAGQLGGSRPGVALATITTLGYGGFLLGPVVIGFIAEAVGLRMALGLVVLTSGVAMGLSLAFRGLVRGAAVNQGEPVPGPGSGQSAVL